jgi:hypothetical protein
MICPRVDASAGRGSAAGDLALTDGGRAVAARDAAGPMMPTDERRRALAMLANAGPRGNTEAIMAVHFTVELLAGLARQGWASVDVETVRAGRSPVGVVRMKITEAGRQALTTGSPR